MHILFIIGIVILCFMLVIGIVRVIFEPYTTFANFLTHLMLIDWVTLIVEWVRDALTEHWD